MVQIILSLILVYLLGSFSTAHWIAKWFYKKDIRTEGSKNAGATNTFRVLGWKPAIVVLIFDVLKAYISVKFIPLLFPNINIINVVDFQILLGIFVVLGHIFPIFSNFKGGKGVASLLGVVLALYNFWIIIILLIIFIIIVSISNYISLGSITVAIVFPFLVFFAFPTNSINLAYFSIAISIFVIFMHRNNIKRLISRKENKFIRKK